MCVVQWMNVHVLFNMWNRNMNVNVFDLWCSWMLMHVYVRLDTCMYDWIRVCMFEYGYVCLDTCMYDWIRACMFEYVYVCLNTCMYAWIRVCPIEYVYVWLTMIVLNEMSMSLNEYVCKDMFECRNMYIDVWNDGLCRQTYAHADTWRCSGMRVTVNTLNIS